MHAPNWWARGTVFSQRTPVPAYHFTTVSKERLLTPPSIPQKSPSQAATFAGASRGDAPPLVSNNASASSRASADVEEAGAFEAPPDDLTPWAFVNQPPRNAVYELQYRTIKNPKLWFELLGASALLFAFCALYLGPVVRVTLRVSV